MLNKVLHIAILSLTVYLFTAFIVWDFDPSSWGFYVRSVAVVVLICGFLFMQLIQSTFDD